MSYVMKGDKLTQVTAPDALLREALEGIACATHPGMDYGDRLCLCAAHENARAALAATPPASAERDAVVEAAKAWRDMPEMEMFVKRREDGALYHGIANNLTAAIDALREAER